MAEKITPRATDYSQWYIDIVKQAGLAENSDVRGCMVIKPNGYAIWEKMQRALDRLFKDTGHVNAYFPLFIPKSFLAKEEEMAEDFAKEWMAMPVLVGPKSEGQKFPGAVYTLCIEALMQDGKALQAGTSHFLGQNFAKAFDVQFQNKEGRLEYAWATSWGLSTRMIGGLIMTHSDDQGLIVPPRLAPTHVVIVPLGKNDAEREASLAAANRLADELRARPRDDFYGYEPLGVKVDTAFDKAPGFR